jgi:hypothetical protein
MYIRKSARFLFTLKQRRGHIEYIGEVWNDIPLFVGILGGIVFIG